MRWSRKPGDLPAACRPFLARGARWSGCPLWRPHVLTMHGLTDGLRHKGRQAITSVDCHRRMANVLIRALPDAVPRRYRPGSRPLDPAASRTLRAADTVIGFRIDTGAVRRRRRMEILRECG